MTTFKKWYLRIIKNKQTKNKKYVKNLKCSLIQTMQSFV